MTFNSRKVNYVSTSNAKINIVVLPYDKCKFKKRNIALIRNYDCFQPFTWLIKIRFSFVPQGFSCQSCNFVVVSSSSFLAGDIQCCSFAMKK